MVAVCAAALAAGLVVRAHVVVPLTVGSSSMEPALSSGDTVLVTRWAPDAADLERGDLVVFVDPVERHRTLKRVVGLPGEELVILDGVLHVDGRAVREPWLPDEALDGYFSRTFEIPPGRVFVLGDNRGNSIDSRDYGSIGAVDLTGRVLARVWPPGRLAQGGGP
ncbi:signal peptidase I [Nocardioides aestuarii]